MASVTAQGIATPLAPDGQFYPTFVDRVPALRGFYLKHDHGGDRHVSMIEVWAGGQSEDLSPFADSNPINIADGTLHVNLVDKDPNANDEDGGEKIFFEVSHSLLAIPGVRRFQFRDVGCAGGCVQPLPFPSMNAGPGSLFPPIIGLVGFNLQFIGDRDRHLKQVGVWFNGNDLHVALRDEEVKLEDTFRYFVDFVVIPSSPFVGSAAGRHSGSARGGQKITVPTPPDTDFMLTGWRFDFVGELDNHIRDLGVLRSGDDITVFYGDAEPHQHDDLFAYTIEWAHVGRAGLAPADV